MIYYLLEKVQTIIEKNLIVSIFLPQKIKIELFLGQNRAKKQKSG